MNTKIISTLILASALFHGSSTTVFAQSIFVQPKYACPFITDSLKLGGLNNIEQVTRLQTFLKNFEKFDISVNGTFDQKTEDAVKIFQKKYADIILAPWGATKASGFVHFTTIKKINQIACGQALTLNTDELATISAYKARGSLDKATQSVEIGSSVSADTINVFSGDSAQNNSNIAVVGEASILSRFWNFLTGLFR